MKRCKETETGGASAPCEEDGMLGCLGHAGGVIYYSFTIYKKREK